jgi:hypothetical protein
MPVPVAAKGEFTTLRYLTYLTVLFPVGCCLCSHTPVCPAL